MIASLLTAFLLTQPMPEPVTTTGYCWHSPCVNAKAAKGVTASGTPVQMGVCAANWKVFPKGSVWFIPGYGLCRVEDTGRLVQHRHLDLFFWDIADAVKWGRKQQHIRRVTMHETQETVGQWATENFGKPTALAVLRRSCDELLEAIEVCVVTNEATRTMFKAMRLGLDHLDKYALPDAMLPKIKDLIAEELADSTIVNYHAATVLEIDLQAAVTAKMDINRRRKWKQNKDGTGQHIDEDQIEMFSDMDLLEDETRL